MHGSRFWQPWLLIALSFSVASVRAANVDDEPVSWSEVDVELPTTSLAVRPIAVDIGPASASQFAVDAASVSVGGDGVVRYLLVVKGSGGAVSVTFEGIRCDSRERKVYAFGRSDGSWSRARNAKWTRVEPKLLNGYGNLLYKEFFCPNSIAVRDAKEAVMALERGGYPGLINQTGH